MYEIDRIETSRVLFASIVGALVTNILAFAVQKLLIERRFQKITDQERRNLAFIERQLEEFYSPMIGCLIQIRAKSNLRFKISEISNEVWMEFVDKQQKPFLESKNSIKPY